MRSGRPLREIANWPVRTTPSFFVVVGIANHYRKMLHGINGGHYHGVILCSLRVM